MITIYHFNRCSKSRQALALLEEKKTPYKIRFYVEEPLSSSEIRLLQQKLNIPLKEMIRSNETEYKDLFGEQNPDDAVLLITLTKHPKLLQRPIVETSENAVIARPPEKLLEII